jgi:large repetitive protein
MIKKLFFLLGCVFLSISLNAQEINCTDGIDNDNDGLIDCLDPDCASCGFAQNCAKPYVYYMPPLWLDANGFNGQTGKPSDVVIATFGSTATVNIGTPDGSWTQTVVVPAGNPANVSIPDNVIALLTANTVINKNAGFIVTSNQPIQVTYRLLSFYNQDLVTLYGATALGYSFYPGSQTDLEPSQFNNNERHFISVIATENNTVVTFKNPMALQGIAANSTTSVTLNAGQTYIVTSPSTAPNTSISGVRVTATKPIAVVSGSQHSNTPQGGDYDAGIEQVIPAHLTGNTYVAIDAGNPNSVKDYLTVIAIENGTEIQVNNQPVANLSAGQVYTYFFDNTVNKSYTVTSANKFYVYHHSTYGASEFGSALLPPISTCIGSTKVDFERPGTEAKALVVIPNAGLSSLKFKGQPYTNFVTASPVNNLSGYSYLVIPNTAIEPLGSNNRLESNSKFNVGIISRSGGTGNYGYYSNYNAEVSVLDPNTGSPTAFIDGGSVTPGVPKQLCVQLQSCGNNNRITSTVPNTYTASLTNNDNCITYTMSTSAPDCSRDTVSLVATNELGLSGRVCIVFSNVNQRINNVNVTPSNPSICIAGSGGNSSVTLTASATSPDGIASYSWLKPDGSTVTGANQTVTEPGVYTLTITNNTGCFVTRVLTVASKNCADTDGDGVNDSADSDDDNDGILDTDESSCFTASPTSTINTPPYAINALINSGPSVSPVNVTGLGGNRFNVIARLVGTASPAPQWNVASGTAPNNGGGIQIKNNFPTVGDYVYAQPINCRGAASTYASYTLEFPTTVENLSFISAGLNGADAFEITAFNGNIPVPISPSDLSNFNSTGGASHWTVSSITDGVKVVGNTNVGGTAVDDNFFTTTIAKTITRVEIKAYKDNASNSTVTVGLRSFNFCTLIDTDGDGVPDSKDRDSDNDGLPDVAETGGVDANGDGVIDCTISASSGLANCLPATGLGNKDSDGDGKPNSRDIDSDNDGITDITESRGGDIDFNGLQDNFLDADGDGYNDNVDFSQSGSPSFVTGPDANGDGRADNYPQLDDRDSDGKPNFIDIDADNDGIVDVIESQNSNTPTTYIAPTGLDSDNDGLDNAYDNFNGLGGGGTNPLNANTDGGSAPDYVDLDSDNDGDRDEVEGWDSNNDGIPNVVKANTDADSDGLDDAYDNNGAAWNPTNGTTPASYPNLDNASTYIQDWRDNTYPIVDSDGDGKPDAADLDDDNDGILDTAENDCNIALQSANFNFNATTTTTPVNGYTDTQGGIQFRIRVTKTPNTNISSVNFDNHYTNVVNPGKEIRLANFGPTKADFSRITYIFDKSVANIKLKAFDVDANGSSTLGDSLIVIPYFKGQAIPYGPADVITSPFNVYFPPFTFNGGGGNALPADTNGDITFKFNFLLDSVQFTFRNRDVATSNSFGVSAPLQTLCNTDFDNDGKPNSIDLDSDNDGITDVIENLGVDADGNGRVDGFTDTDNDGLADKYDANNGGNTLNVKNFDGDTRPNFLDIDSDNDGITDIIEVRGDDFTTNVFNGIVDGNTDVDGDGLLDAVDPQIGNASGTGTPIIIATDANNDGIADAWPQDNPDNDLTNPIFLDIDADNDGIIDNVEAQTTAGFIPPGTFTDANNNGLNDIYETPTVKGLNPLLANSDGGSAPDYTDRDSDNDGVLDIVEGWDIDNDGVANTLGGTLDANGNGLLDGYETAGLPTITAPTGHPNVNNPSVPERDWREKNDFDKDGISDDTDLDDDNDGILDAVEGTSDTDGDGSPDNRDIDADNDGIVDYIEAQVSSATPIVPGTADADQDGILDAFDSQPSQFGGNGITPVNTDGADNDDYKDLDSDNDGVTDYIEAYDANNNGVIDGTEKVPGTADADNDGLLDGFDANTALVNPTNGQTSSSFPNLDNPSTPERDWREKDDFDGDGVADQLDPDDDNDGILDVNELNTDTDGDGNPDSKDLDSDNDGIPDVAEAGGVDANGDGIIDCTITASTGLASCLPSTGLPNTDSDGDGVPNSRDIDSDNDGITDIAEVGGANLDTDGDGRIDNPADSDNDGLADAVDPSNPSPVVAGTPVFTTGPDTNNNGTADSYPNDNADGDTRPNFLDLDSDNDGITDVIEAGGTDTNGDGVIDGFADTNGNGLADIVDPTTSGTTIKNPLGNPDFDGDGIPNTLDLDSDNDGITDVKEAGGLDNNGDGKQDGTADTDNDGLLDSVDGTPILVTGADTNGDGRPNSYPIGDNQDGTGGPNFLDIDADDDGIVDNIEGQPTAGYVAPSGQDTDGDGIDNAYETLNVGNTNTDATDNPDYLDTDSDNDGLSDLIEGNDANGDGTPDVTPSGNDADKDGLDDAFDANDAAPIVTNGQTPNSFPNIDKPLTPERDWREVTDTDGDGIADNLDLDDDNDGVLDAVEGNGDKDGDGLPDSKDLDSDNDGIPDTIENGAPDADKDGIIDGFVDTNGDGLSDPLATNPIVQLDSDGDGKPNQDDIDSDNDGITDVIEAGGLDPDGNGQIGTGSGASIPDTDNDGLADAVDPKTGATNNPNATPLPIRNTDNNGKPDYLDIDSDDDGIVDNIEGQATLGYTAPSGTDTDGDGLDNAYDNNNGFGGSGLTNLPNSDNGGTPDYRDTDADNDGLSDIIEKGGATSGGTTDADGDGLLDGFDANIASPTATGTAANVTNGNLTPLSYPNTQKPSTQERDWREGATDPDFDQDGVVDLLDTDDDNDGIPDLVEGNNDTDGDGQPDSKDRDSDNDGIPDTIENGVSDTNGDGIAGPGTPSVNANGEVLIGGNPVIVNTPLDFDGDGKPNYLDLDSDNDGITDITEAGGSDPDNNGQIGTGIAVDTDGDGLADVVDGTPLPLTNTDSTGGPDYLDIDADNDGIVDNIEAQPTGAYIAPTGNDTDNDGIDDAYDANPLFGGSGIINLPNTDGTTTPDYQDTDSDGDGLTDIQENGTNVTPSGNDTDGDGLDNAFDSNNGTGSPLGNVANVTNGNQTPNSFPNTQNAQTPERDWRDNSSPQADFDGDGIPDVTDSDDDNDGVPDSVEGNTDTDGDGNPDSQDLDADNDGIPDTIENGVSDPDKDGIAGSLPNPIVNSNGEVLDGSGNPILISVELDQDGDGKPNAKDLDSDNDGITDVIEAGGSDPDNNGQIGTGTGSSIPDIDNDGLADIVDPTNPSSTNPGNPLPTPNSDNTGRPDYLDIDADDDGIVDNIESQGTFTYVIPTGTDSDNDGIDNAYDNNNGFGGSGISNPVNTDGVDNPDYIDTDTDNDGLTDLLEGGFAAIPVNVDTDNDGLLDALENPAVTGSIGGVSNVTNANILAGQPNFPNNQNPTTPEKDWRDATIPTEDFDGDGIADVFDLDDDNDGILDTDEGNGLTDTDGDGNPDSKDRDSDNDGIPDTKENGILDTNGDGVADGVDSDNDGLLDPVDPSTGGTPVTPLDFDGDGKPNYLDLDSDNDGIVDVIEAGGSDPDGNGQIGSGTGLNITDVDDDGLADAVDPIIPGGSNVGTPLSIPNTDGVLVNGQVKNPDYLDIDADDDGIVDVIEAQPTSTYIVPSGSDSDNDGIDNAFDNFNGFGGKGTEPVNTDGSDNPDYTDTDSDNDAKPDNTENGKPIPTTIADADGDGLIDGYDTNAGTPSTLGTVANVTNGQTPATSSPNTENTVTPERDWREFIDSDGDGVSNNNDVDDDNDGILDSDEPIGDADGDGIPNSLDTDSDNDGIPDVVEAGGVDANADGVIDCTFNATTGLANCLPNTGLGEPDFDGDGVVNALDIDSDNDGITDVIEAGGTDANGDGKNDTSGSILATGSDTNGDGKADSYPNDNADASGLPNYLDIDADDDGIPDNIEAQPTTGVIAGANYVAPSGIDADNNGLDDIYQTSTQTGKGLTPINTDATLANSDAIPDYLDLNSDGDALTDRDESIVSTLPSGVDTDGDGLDNVYENNPASSGNIGSVINVTNGGKTPSSYPNLQNGSTPQRDWRDPTVLPTPTITDELAVTTIGTPIVINVTGNDNPAGQVTLGNVVTNPSNGTVTTNPTNGSITYTPTPTFVGYDTVVVQVCLGTVCLNDTVFITVRPKVIASAITTNINTTFPNGNATLTNNPTTGLVYNPTTVTTIGPNNGVLTVNPNGTFSFTPNTGFTGTITYTVEACFTAVNPSICVVDTIIANVLPNGLPVVNDEVISTTVNTPVTVNILANDAPSGSISVSPTVVNNVNNGTATILNGVLTYTPNNGFIGYDTLVVDVCLNGGGCLKDTVFITVRPKTVKDISTTAINTPVTGNANTNNTPNSGLVFGTPVPVGASNGLLVVNPNGTYTFTPNNGFTGTVQFLVPVCLNTVTPPVCENDTIVIIVQPGQPVNTDGDNVSDVNDVDDDNDGITDANENDTNGDGVINNLDNPDVDGDGTPNSLDLDSDNDGIPDVIEAGGLDENGDGIIDCTPISSVTGLASCLPNTGLGIVDTDQDGVPNTFDIDSDDDGITDVIEAGGTDPDGNGQIGTGSGNSIPDADNDGLADIVDPIVGYSGTTIGTGTAIIVTGADTNGDGKPDSYPSTDNTDGGDKPDFLDIDSDNDGIVDNIEGQSTTGYIPPSGLDNDKDGLDNAYDNNTSFGGNGTTPVNTDGTDKPDYLDTDSDNDGKSDIAENGLNISNPANTDTDNDGLLNAFDNVSTGPASGIANETNGSQTAANFPNTNNSGDRDWREAEVASDVEIPTGFTPNADGIIIKGLDDASEIEMIVFNRWGNIVFKTNDIKQNPWKGQNEGDLTIAKSTINAQNTSGEIVPEGTYFYIINYKNKAGEKKAKQGYIYIKY